MFLPFLSKTSRSSVLVLLWYLVAVLWWLVLTTTGSQEQTANYLFGLFVIGGTPVAGGLFGLYRSWRWGFPKSWLGRTMFFLSLGLIAWGCGALMYSYNNFFLGVEAPYPSLADFAYLASYPFWALGVVHLLRVTGASISLKNFFGKIQLLIIPIVAVAISYYLLIIVARGGVLDLTGDFSKIVVDIAYPFSDIVMVTLTTLVLSLSFRTLGGRFRVPIFTLLAGFLINYAADFAFGWQTTLGTWYVGNWVDLLFATSMTLLVLGISGLNPDYRTTS